MKTSTLFITLVIVASAFRGLAQTDSSTTKMKPVDASAPIDSSKQRDVIDLIEKALNKSFTAQSRQSSKKLIFAAVPGLGYSLTNGFGAALLANVAFYTEADHKNNLSEISLEGFIDTKSQKAFKNRSEIWFGANDFKLVSDIRFERFPENTYGIGTFTTDATQNPIDYLYLRSYLTLYKKIVPDYFVGIGYNLDHHYDITATGNANGTESDFMKYGQTSSSTSSGTTINLLYDSRRNPINSLNGAYARISLRNNFTFLGSDNNWNQVQIDLRKYLRLSPNNNNVLAFWAIAAFTSGNAPYLDLPATGSDMYNESGRGYQEDRFVGKNELYFESEYRFGITSNGLIGGVVFANGQSFSELNTNRFAHIAPAAGTGLRIKINKHSNTNACIDYAYGTGSHGFFVNLGEVF